MLIFALVGWLFFMPKVRLSSLYLLMSLEYRMSQRNECAMFNFQRIVHVVKDDAYDANNNVIRHVYHVLIIDDLGLEWTVNLEGLRFATRGPSLFLSLLVFCLLVVNVLKEH